MPWPLQHLFWYVQDYSRVGAARESGRLGYCIEVGGRVKMLESFKADCRFFCLVLGFFIVWGRACVDFFALVCVFLVVAKK